MKISNDRNDLIITGIPRSGTSLLCSMLNSLENTAIINEPQEIFKILLRPQGIWPLYLLGRKDLKTYYTQLRKRLAAGKQVWNKDVADTRHSDIRVRWRPKSLNDQSDFILGTKNTLLYTCNLQSGMLDDFRIIALVRHPFNVIRSWISLANKPGFNHLVRATIPFYAYLLKDSLTEDFKKTYLSLSHKPDDLNSLCGFWNLLTGIYLQMSSKIIIVKYEDLVKNPSKIISTIVGKESIIAEANKMQPTLYQSNDQNNPIIWEQCKKNASDLGYSQE